MSLSEDAFFTPCSVDRLFDNQLSPKLPHLAAEFLFSRLFGKENGRVLSFDFSIIIAV
jgi:hypothetical protein